MPREVFRDVVRVSVLLYHTDRAHSRLAMVLLSYMLQQIFPV